MKPRKARESLKRTLLSEHELKLFCVAAHQTGWWTSREMAAKAGLKRRIVHEHLLRWLDFGILERIEIAPEHRWRISASAQSIAHYNRLRTTAVQLGWWTET